MSGKMTGSKAKTLTFEEKIELLDQDIRNLHEFCVAQGYEREQIERCAEPLLAAVRDLRRRKVLSVLGKVVLVIAAIVGLYYYDPVYRTIWALARLASIKMLPYWDWTRLHDDECLINNPYYVGSHLTEEDCMLCEDLDGIARMENMSTALLAEDHLKRDVPVIITDALDEWPARSLFTIHFLEQLYSKEADLKDTLPCMFASNVRVKYGNPRALLARAANGDITNWYAHWENCMKPAAKVLRQFYRRPYFMPHMVEMAEPNWVFVASKYKGKRNKPADIAQPMMWIAQLKGEIKFTLTPRSPCEDMCSTLYATLHEGEILVVTDLLWLTDYMPVSDGDTIAIGSGGYFD